MENKNNVCFNFFKTEPTFVSVYTYLHIMQDMVNKMAACLLLKNIELVLTSAAKLHVPVKTMWYTTKMGVQFDPLTAFTVHASQHGGKKI